MSQKVEKPSLSGQRIKTRKRDEKEKYDPLGFRDAILMGLESAGCTASDLDGVHKYLDTAGSKLDYRRYSEVLFDLLIAGGILAPGGSVVEDARSDGQPGTTEICIFCAKDDAHLKGYANLLVKLIRRYKYLERALEDSFGKVMMFLRGFEAEQRHKLAIMSALLLTVGLITPSTLVKLLQDHLVKEGLALQYLITCLKRWNDEKDAATIWSTLRRFQVEIRLLDFMAVSKRSEANLEAALSEGGLNCLVEYHKQHAFQSIKRDLQNQISQLISSGAAASQTAALVKECQIKYSLADQDAVVLLWNTLMSQVEWNKKEDLAAEQSLKYLRQQAPLLAQFTNGLKAQLALLRAVQDFCYDNIDFLKVFQKIVVLLYKHDVVAEDAICKWYTEGHSQKGKTVFLEQMKNFIEWLQNAEEESEEEEED